MKQKNLLGFIIFVGFLYTKQTIIACPTCIGNVDSNTPVFFSDNFYCVPISNKENNENFNQDKNNNESDEHQNNENQTHSKPNNIDLGDD